MKTDLLVDPSNELLHQPRNILGLRRHVNDGFGVSVPDHILPVAIGRGFYYMGRSQADITKWIAYFIEGMATSFEKVRDQALRQAKKGGKDQSTLLRNLDSKQRRALTLFQKSREIAAKDVAGLFGYRPRTAALLCQRWVEKGFLETTDPAKKSRRYKLGDTYASIVDEID